MFNSYKALRRGDLSSVNNSMLYPLLRWCSGNRNDLSWCSEVNKTFFWLPPEIAKGYIYIGLGSEEGFTRYPKAAKKDDDKVAELRKSLIKQYYRWSKQELERNLGVIEFVDIGIVADALGIEDKERKLLGLQVIKVKPVKVVDKPKKKNLFDY